jgi:ubiquinone/menaquinone biosynthesis C-methylase UbiE
LAPDQQRRTWLPTGERQVVEPIGQVCINRSKVFSKWTDAPEEFSQLTAHLPSHSFLANPSGAQPFVYLTNFVAQQVLSWWQVAPSEVKLLDWGCGKGQVSFLLKSLGIQTVAADVPGSEPETPLLEASGSPFVPLTHDYQLPFPDESFHSVVSYGVLEHVPNDYESLKEITRVLKPGGLFFVFNLPQSTSWIMRLAHLRGNHYHDRLYNIETTRYQLQCAGLRTIDSWQRQLFPKNCARYPSPRKFEMLDQFLCKHTPLRAFATSIEFLAVKDSSK